LREADLAAAFSSNLAGASPPPSPHATDAKGIDPSEESAAETAKVNTEPDGDTLPLSGKKRKRGETANVEDEVCRSPLTTPPPASPPGLPARPLSGGSAAVSDPCARRGFFDPKPQHSPVPDAHDGDSADWKVSQKVLECIVTPSRDDKFAASKPTDVVASTYVAMLQRPRTTCPSPRATRWTWTRSWWRGSATRWCCWSSWTRRRRRGRPPRRSWRRRRPSSRR
uniref:Uncharacterized protein n=1 Tax=Aegilops tauschii subsp. strangulata TaxID=200361 RepID=A0A453QW42_AEGTS